MASKSFNRIAREVAKRDYGTFQTLMEFEESKRIRTKVRMDFTVDRNIAARFKRLCREKGYNMSAKVEQAMEKLVREH